MAVGQLVLLAALTREVRVVRHEQQDRADLQERRDRGLEIIDQARPDDLGGAAVVGRSNGLERRRSSRN